jgi:hypothetical protein
VNGTRNDFLAGEGRTVWEAAGGFTGIMSVAYGNVLARFKKCSVPNRKSPSDKGLYGIIWVVRAAAFLRKGGVLWTFRCKKWIMLGMFLLALLAYLKRR